MRCAGRTARTKQLRNMESMPRRQRRCCCCATDIAAWTSSSMTCRVFSKDLRHTWHQEHAWSAEALRPFEKMHWHHRTSLILSLLPTCTRLPLLTPEPALLEVMHLHRVPRRQHLHGVLDLGDLAPAHPMATGRFRDPVGWVRWASPGVVPLPTRQAMRSPAGWWKTAQ